MSWHAVPNFIVDELMATITPAAYKVHAVIVRQTIGWHRTEDAISTSQFMELTGLSKNSVIRAIRELMDCHAIIRSEYVANGVSSYTYRIASSNIEQGSSEIEQPSSNLGSAKSEQASSNIEQTSAKNEQGGGSNLAPGVVQNLNTQKKDINKQETNKNTTRHAVAVEPADDVQSSSPKKTEHRKAEQRDERLDSWQVIAYRELARLSPPHAIRDRMVSEITDEPRWRDSVREWIGKGWSPRNISGMIDFYNGKKKETRHEEPHRDADGKSDLQRRMEAYLEENKKWLDPEYGAAQRSGPPPPPPHRSRQDWRD
jgi:phage replication O-like protein O